MEATQEAAVLKSSIVLEIKPWGDDTDMKEMENNVRKIEMDTLVWGEGKLVPVGFGVSKLTICAVVESDKADCDLLVERIEQLEDFVQSVEVIQFKSTSTFFHNRLE